MTALHLPEADGTLAPYTLCGGSLWPKVAEASHTRTAYAAVHVVADPWGDNGPGRPAVVDWDATQAFRQHIWSCGLGVAEAMDTAQRGMGLDWTATRELIRRSASGAEGPLACGAGTDHVPDARSIEDVITAYEQQIAYVEDHGATVILMASRHLARIAKGPDDYAKVYGRLLDQVGAPVILHWLGAGFDPALTGYWGTDDIPAAIDVVAGIIRDHAAKVDGIKVSLLDETYERALRDALPEPVRVYTGDDFNYPSLIESGSHALLGIFDPIAPVARAALRCLDEGDIDGYTATFAPTVPLARHLFSEPTFHYKTGIVFLAWLAGHQSHFTMVGGLQSARSLPHLAQTLRLADDAGLLPDADLAAGRMRHLLALHGIEQ